MAEEPRGAVAKVLVALVSFALRVILIKEGNQETAAPLLEISHSSVDAI